MHDILQALIQYGYILLFLWLFIERLGIPIPATIPLDSIGSLLWVGFFMGAGYIFSREIQLERIALPDWGQGRVVIAILLLLALYIVWKYLRKQYLLRKLFSNRMTPEELKGKMDVGDEIAILDVRHPLEFEADPYVIPGALYFPLENLKLFSAVPVEREIVTYCA
jgi:hypothetical protein